MVDDASVLAYLSLMFFNNNHSIAWFSMSIKSFFLPFSNVVCSLMKQQPSMAVFQQASTVPGA
jgi:hypothetical protein